MYIMSSQNLGSDVPQYELFAGKADLNKNKKKQKMLTPTVTIPKCIEIYSCNTFTLFHHDLNIEDVSLKQFPSNEFLVRKQRPFR